jgi:uncharacterized small protein (DUF1192 family)
MSQLFSDQVAVLRVTDIAGRSAALAVSRAQASQVSKAAQLVAAVAFFRLASERGRG